MTTFKRYMVLFALAANLGLQGANAQNFPSRPIRMILPGPAGGGADVIARPLASKLTEILGQQVIVDNRPGASGLIAGDLTAKAPADGYTLILATSSGFSISPHLVAKPPYDPTRDFRGVSLVAMAELMVAVHPSLPVRSVKEVIALAKAKPSGILFASNGAGSLSHLATELFQMMSGITMVHVPYKGGTPAVTDTVAGNTALIITAVPTLMAMVNAGRLRALATTGSTRSKLIRDLPTVAEAGLPEYEVTQWYGLFVPAQTSPQIVRTLQAGVARALQSSEVQQVIRKGGSEPVGSTGEEMEQFLKKDSAKWENIIRRANVKIN